MSVLQHYSITKMFKKLFDLLKNTKFMYYKNVNAQDFKQIMEETEDAVILDVRSEAELAEGSISGYQLVNFFTPDFASKIDKMDREKTYFVYCRSGNRSGSACSFMASKGFKKLYNLSGGIGAWNAMYGTNIV